MLAEREAEKTSTYFPDFFRKMIRASLGRYPCMFKLFKLSLPMLAVIVAGIFLCGAGAMLLTAYTENDREEKAVFSSLQEQQEKERVPLQEKTIYLTFDDGPSKNTQELRKVLSKYNVKATFFVTHENEEYTKEMAVLSKEGHTVAPHAYSHDYGKIYGSPSGYLEDFEKIFTLVEEQTGKSPKIFRFPGGSRNSNADPYILSEIIAEMERKGFTYFDWNAVSGDDTPIVYSAETLAENVFSQQGEKPYMVVLFHDANLCTTTPQAVEMVIQHYQAEGWSFLPLTDSSEPLQFSKAIK